VRPYYSHEIAACFLHPEIQQLEAPTQEALLIHHLFAYLDFTTHLELGPVNDALLLIWRGHRLPALPEQCRQAALRIYTDEAAHAEMCDDFIRQTVNATGLQPARGATPAFLGRLDAILEDAHHADVDLLRLFFAIVSETLITGTLHRLATDRSIHDSVRQLALDHAQDEARHNAVFRQIFQQVWPGLDRETQIRVGSTIPAIIRAYLDFDLETFETVFRITKHDLPNASHTLREIEILHNNNSLLRSDARPVVQLLNSVGSLDRDAIHSAFVRAQLIS